MRGGFFFIGFLLLLTSGCQTTQDEIIWDSFAVRKFARSFKDPRYYGLSIYETKGGGETVSDGFRLHYSQTVTLPMTKSAPAFAPFVVVQGRFGDPQVSLIDLASPECWADLDAYSQLRMVTLGYQQAIPYRGNRSLGGASAYLSLCTQLRLGALYVENALIYTRLATGGLGPIDRDIDEPAAGMVLGWDLIRRFEVVRFDFAERRVSFSSTAPAEIDESRLSGTAEMIEVPGYGCVVAGSAAGRPQRFVLDPAGDFELAWPNKAAAVMGELSVGTLAFRNVAVSAAEMDGDLPHIGGRLLSKYAVTLCPRRKKVYFQAGATGK